MKAILTIFTVLFLMLLNISIANASVVCGTNWQGIKGCTGPNGTIVRGHGGNTFIVPNNHRHHHHRHHPIHRPRCTWINGTQICR